jgi:hypothetical protein
VGPAWRGLLAIAFSCASAGCTGVRPRFDAVGLGSGQVLVRTDPIPLPGGRELVLNAQLFNPAPGATPMAVILDDPARELERRLRWLLDAAAERELGAAFGISYRF